MFLPQLETCDPDKPEQVFEPGPQYSILSSQGFYLSFGPYQVESLMLMPIYSPNNPLFEWKYVRARVCASLFTSPATRFSVLQFFLKASLFAAPNVDC